jgi:hypothetical protein
MAAAADSPTFGIDLFLVRHGEFVNSALLLILVSPGGRVPLTSGVREGYSIKESL